MKLKDAICNMALDCKAITKEGLIRLGASEEEIQSLIDSKVIIMVKEDEYELVSEDVLYECGLRLFAEGNFSRAKRCVMKCYDLNSNHRGGCLQVFYDNILKNNYYQAFKMLDKLYHTNDVVLIKETNLYLYLLNFIVPCPDRYIDRVKSITRDDLALIGYDEEDAKGVLDKIFQGNTKSALSYFERIYVTTQENVLKKMIIKKMLFDTIEYSRELPGKILNCVQNEQYEELEVILKNKSRTRRFNVMEKYLLRLVQDIRKIIETGDIPEVMVFETDNFFQAIRGRNFELAEKLNNSYHKPNKGDNDVSLELLLRKINVLIGQIKLERELKRLQDIAYDMVEVGVLPEVFVDRKVITRDEMLLIKLIYVRDLFIDGNYDDGDARLHEVEVIEGKSLMVEFFVKELKANKFYYGEKKEGYIKNKKRDS